MNRGDWITLYAFVKTVAGEFWFVLAAFAVVVMGGMLCLDA